MPAPKKQDISQIQPSSTLLQMMPTQTTEPLLKGYVMKKSSKSKLLSLWQRRYLVF
jgi:hypothetical protein